MVGCILGTALAAGIFAYRALDSGIAVAIEDKSAKMSSATVVSAARFQAEDNVGVQAEELYRICFTIDGLDQIRPSIRSQYEAAEHKRESASGPRCKITGVRSAARARAGDKIQVVYLLENDNQIDITSIRVFGADIGPEGVTYSGSGKVR
jgi:hypothetical protein